MRTEGNQLRHLRCQREASMALSPALYSLQQTQEKQKAGPQYPVPGGAQRSLVADRQQSVYGPDPNGKAKAIDIAAG